MNSKNSILLVDPEFDPNTAENCNLLIRITADSLSYAIIDKTHQQIKAVYDRQDCRDVAEVLSARLKQDTYLMLTFKEVKISVYTENTIAIPNAIFDEQDLDSYAKFFSATQSNKLYVQPANQYGLTTIFSLDQFVDELLRSSLECLQFFNHEAPVLAMTAEKKKVLILDFTAASFNALYINEGQVIFQNYYQVENVEEFNYYLLFMLKTLQINASETEVNLSGIIHTGDPNHLCISKYFNQIQFTEAPALTAIDRSILEDMPAHYYSSLLALDLCG